jgi:hypothetical protein
MLDGPFLGAFAESRKEPISFVLTVCSRVSELLSLDGLARWGLNEHPLVKTKFGYNLVQISGIPHKSLSTFIVAGVITGVLISP